MIDGVPQVPFYSVGHLDVECSNCGCLHFAAEKVRGKSTFNDCCRHGKFPDTVVTWPPYPDELAHYFIGDYSRAQKNIFLDSTRMLNNAFACGCYCSNKYKFKTPGVPCERIYGQVFHRLNTDLLPNDADKG